MGFFDASGKAAKFTEAGDSVTGTVVSWREENQKEFGTDNLATWPDGNPKMQAVIVLRTDEQDSEDDDGLRSVYVASSRQKRALIGALQKGGSKEPEEGGTLTMTYLGDDPQSKNPKNPAKMYSATWVKPSKSSVFGGTDAKASAAEVAQTSQPVAQQQTAKPAAVASSPSNDKVLELLKLGGLEDSVIAMATGVPVETVTALRNALVNA